MNGLLQDVRYAFRTFTKTPAFTAVVVLTLALGIGANTAIFSVVRGVLVKTLPYRDPGRLVRIGHVRGEGARLGSSFSPDDVEDKHHDEAGGEVLAPFFPPVIVECVRLHVSAKRYLCATDPTYFSRLSQAFGNLTW